MLIYRGYGIAAFGIIFGCPLAANVICNVVARDGGAFWNEHGWPLACALLAAGAGVWMLDLGLSRRIAPGARHHLFFIPLRYWGFLSGAIGIAILLSGWSPGK